MKTHLDVEKGNFAIYLIRSELMLKGKSDLWVINAMKIGVEPKFRAFEVFLSIENQPYPGT